eukprot:137791_1
MMENADAGRVFHICPPIIVSTTHGERAPTTDDSTKQINPKPQHNQTVAGSTSVTKIICSFCATTPSLNQIYQPCLEKEKEAAARRRAPPLLPRLDFSSPLVVSAVTSARESTPPAWVPALPSTSLPSSSTSAPRSSSSLAML